PTGPPPGGVPPQPGPGGGGGTWPWSGAPGGPVGADHWLGGGCSFDHFTPGPSGVRSGCPGCAGCPAGREADGAGPSDGVDPGEAQPGVSFIIAPSRCPSAGAAAVWQPSCHGVVVPGPGEVGPAHLQLSAPQGADWRHG